MSINPNRPSSPNQNYRTPSPPSNSAIQADEAARIRRAYGLQPTATEQELQAAIQADSAARIRRTYGLQPTATEQELQAARTSGSYSYRPSGNEPSNAGDIRAAIHTAREAARLRGENAEQIELAGSRAAQAFFRQAR